jgi:hypothetical protein
VKQKVPVRRSMCRSVSPREPVMKPARGCFKIEREAPRARREAGGAERRPRRFERERASARASARAREGARTRTREREGADRQAVEEGSEEALRESAASGGGSVRQAGAGEREAARGAES